MAVLHSLTRPATREHLPELRAFVERALTAAGVAREPAAALVLATDEVCSNLVEHGYAGRATGAIAVTIEVLPGMVRLEVADHGKPFPPNAAPPPDLTSNWQTRRIGGLGWHLVRNCVDHLEYVTDRERGNRLTLYKSLPPS